MISELSSASTVAFHPVLKRVKTTNVFQALIQYFSVFSRSDPVSPTSGRAL